MPLNLANGVEATAEIILKVAGQGAIYLRSTEDDLITNSDNDSILMLLFLTMNQGWFLKTTAILKVLVWEVSDTGF